MGTGDKHCCLFIELELGIWILGAFQIMYAVQSVMSIVFVMCFFMYYKSTPSDMVIYCIIMLLC